MHGIVRPSSDDMVVETDRLAAIRAKLHEYRFFLLLVVLPTLIVAGYYYLIAADQYESEADFIVRSSQATPASVTGLSSLLTFGGPLKGAEDATNIVDYLQSTEATLAMERSTGLVKRFHTPDADYLSRLRSPTPSPEKLRKYYNKQIKLKLDKETGITKLTVHAFNPADSYAIAKNLLQLGEQRINDLNGRSNADAVVGANRLLAETEDDLRELQIKLKSFRRSQGDIDPEATGRAQMTMVTTLTGNLTTARAQLSAMRGIISPNSPQYIATLARVRALEGEVARQDSRIAGGGTGTIANSLGDYENLRVRQTFLEKRYELAAAAVESARDEARKQRIYLVRVVNPNLPVAPLFPERARIVLTVFASLMIAYGIGWLLVAGIREHAQA